MSTVLQRLQERERVLKAKLVDLGSPARLSGLELRRRNRLVAQLNVMRKVIFAHRQRRLHD